jgi:hypothetical protein
MILPPSFFAKQKPSMHVRPDEKQKLVHSQRVNATPLSGHGNPKGALKAQEIRACGEQRYKFCQIERETPLRTRLVAGPHAVEETFPEFQKVEVAEGCVAA